MTVLIREFLMRRKVIGFAVIALMLGIAAILYRTLQSHTYRVEDILAAYKQNGEYVNIAIEYPHDETLFPPEMVPPVYRWKDSVPASKLWLILFEFPDGSYELHFPAAKVETAAGRLGEHKGNVA